MRLLSCLSTKVRGPEVRGVVHVGGEGRILHAVLLELASPILDFRSIFTSLGWAGFHFDQFGMSPKIIRKLVSQSVSCGSLSSIRSLKDLIAACVQSCLLCPYHARITGCKFPQSQAGCKSGDRAWWIYFLGK